MIAVGVGASRGCPPPELAALVEAALDAAGVTAAQVTALASADLKADEPAILALAATHGWPLRTFPAPALAAVDVPTPSEIVQRYVGTPSVAEAAALLAIEAGRLLVTKRRSPHATCAIAATRPAATTSSTASRDDSILLYGIESSLDGLGGPREARGHACASARVYAATVDCRGCGACLKTCPERALRPAPPSFDGPPLLTLIDRCTGCGECLEICPADAFVACPPEEAPWPV